jgi:hypothetical protein
MQSVALHSGSAPAGGATNNPAATCAPNQVFFELKGTCMGTGRLTAVLLLLASGC